MFIVQRDALVTPARNALQYELQRTLLTGPSMHASPRPFTGYGRPAHHIIDIKTHMQRQTTKNLYEDFKIYIHIHSVRPMGTRMLPKEYFAGIVKTCPSK